MSDTALGWWGVPLALFAGAIRSSTPFLFVSLGELLTEKSGRINLGQEGILILGAMCSYGVAFFTGSPWFGVLMAGCAGAMLGSVHAALCSLPRVNDIALGIAIMLFGTGLAFYGGKPFIQPQAPRLAAIPLGWWSDLPQIQAALQINVLFLLGGGLSLLLAWGLTHTRWGLILQVVGDSADAARALGYSVLYVRWAATAIGGFLAGIGGSFLSLYYPGSWNEGLSSGQGLMAVALVIFARWKPLACFWTALLFGGAGALGPALQSVGVTQGYYLFHAAPYVLTLTLMIVTSTPRQRFAGAPGELSVTK